jgi:hypothetical protein
MRDEGCCGLHEGAYRMVHHPEMQALEVGDVAGRVEGQDLSAPVVQQLVATDETRQDKAALARPVSGPNDVLPTLEVPNYHRQVHQCLLLLLREGRNTSKLADKTVSLRREVGLRHGMVLRLGADEVRSSRCSPLRHRVRTVARWGNSIAILSFRPPNGNLTTVAPPQPPPVGQPSPLLIYVRDADVKSRDAVPVKEHPEPIQSHHTLLQLQLVLALAPRRESQTFYSAIGAWPQGLALIPQRPASAPSAVRRNA